MGYSRHASLTPSTSAGSNPGSITLASVPAGADLICWVACRNDPVTSGETVASISSSPSLTWALVDATDGKVLRNTDDTNGRQGLYAFHARVASANTYVVTPTLTNAANNRVVGGLIELTGMASSGPIDGHDTATAVNADSTITAGPTATLTQADQTAIAIVLGRWWWQLNGTGDGGTAPSGWTRAVGSTDNSMLPYQVAYREISSTTALSAAWTVPASQGDGGQALIFTLKKSVGTLRTRVKFKTGSGINGVTGITVKLWRGDPDTNYSTTYAGRAAEASGDVMYTPAPAGAVDGDTLNVVAFKTGSPAYSTEYRTATVEVTP